MFSVQSLILVVMLVVAVVFAVLDHKEGEKASRRMKGANDRNRQLIEKMQKTRPELNKEYLDQYKDYETCAKSIGLTLCTDLEMANLLKLYYENCDIIKSGITNISAK